MGGDLNVVRFPGERNREGRCIGAMRRFSQVIDDLGLKDLPLQGGAFTWTGGSGKQRMARLDRFLILDDWEFFFINVNKRILLKPLLDNFLILLIGGGSIVRGPFLFRFENMCLKAEGFKKLIDDLWKSIEVRGASSFLVVENLKALKLKIKCWNKEVFERVEERKNQALKNLTH